MTWQGITVHGVRIPEALLAMEAQNHPRRSVAEAREAAGHALAAKALLLHRAAALGLVGEPQSDSAGRTETADAALIGALLDSEIAVDAPSDADCRRFYEAHRARFSGPALYEAAHILFEPRSPAPADDNDAQRAAAQLVDTLIKEPERFPDLARAHSACPSAATGGALGQLVAGDLAPEIEKALAGAAAGEIVPVPVRSRFGWHVLRLLRRIDGAVLPFEGVADRIREHLEERARTAAAARYLLDLSEDARSKRLSIALDEAGQLTGEPICLGDFLDDTAASKRLLIWLDGADGDLAGRIRSEAGAAGLEADAFVRAATARFVRDANDERWTQVLSAIRDATDPALAALSEILRSTLRPPRRSTTIFPRRMA